MSDNVSIEKYKKYQGNEKEDSDHKYEVEFWPKIFDFCLADCSIWMVRVFNHGHNGSCQSKRKDPGHYAGQTS